MIETSDVIIRISQCGDEKKLRNWISNARKLGAQDVEKAAFQRLIEILPQEQPGTLEWDFWRMIYAFEFMLTSERERTTRLSRTRQKVAKIGVQQTLVDWALDSKETAGFLMLLERNMLELSGEAIILRHPTRFGEDVREAASRRLQNAQAS